MQIFIFVDGKNGQQFAIQLSTEGGGGGGRGST
jgi:hypothetical protein